MENEKDKSWPVEKLGAVRFRDIFKTMARTFLILAVVNAVVCVFLSAFPQNRAYWLVKEKWKLLETREKPADMLVLGDSSCSMGVAPEALRGNLGMDALNLCVFAGMIAVNDAWMLDRYIQKHGAPKAVLISHIYYSWTNGPNYWALAKVPQKSGYWRRLRPSLGNSPGVTARMWLGRYVPFFSENKTIGEIIKSPLAMLSRDFHIQQDGMTPIEKADPENVEADMERILPLIKNPKEFKISPANLKALDAISELAENAKFDVYIVNSPLYRGLAENPRYREYFKSMESVFVEYTKDKKRVHYIPGQLTYEKNQMEDSDHLIRPAAFEFTNEISQMIEKASRDK